MKKNVKRIVGASLVGAICFGLGTAVTLANNVKVEAATTDFQMKTGAAVRLASDSAGLRFIAEMDESKYNAVIDSATGEYKTGMSLGMVIVPTAYVENAPSGTTEWLDYIGDKKKVVLDIPAEKVYEKDGSWCFNGVLTNIAFNSLNIDFIGIAYSHDGTAYDYADFTVADNSRNVAEVASSALNDTSVTYSATDETLLQDFITDTLYREAGVFAYEDGDTVLYYDSYTAYQADTERTNGSADIQTAASSLGYTLAYIDVQDSAEFSLADGETTLTVESAVTGADYSNIIQWSSSNENVATVENGKVTAVSEGNTTITATLFGKAYQTNVDVITAYVSNANEFANIANKANGHYVLTSDIDFGGVTLSSSLFTETPEKGVDGNGNCSPADASVGFLGTFDGRGHTLSNMTLSSSLFGTVGRRGVVKNVFVDVNSLKTPATFAMYHYGVIDNVGVNITDNKTQDIGNPHGVIAMYIEGWSGSQGNYGLISNVYVKAENLWSQYRNSSLIAYASQGYFPAIKNCVAVCAQTSDTAFPIIKTLPDKGAGIFENNAAYTSTAELTAYDFSKTGFNEYWHIDENNVPTMRFETVIEESYDVELAAQTDFVIDFAEDVKSITIGDTAISSYTVSGGKLTIPYATLSTITPNDYQMIIETESKSYETNIAIITKIIKKADDLIALHTTEDVTAYYVLGDNITLTGTFAGITTGTFSGIFDGRGHTISGGNIIYGILGKNTNNITIRNLAVTEIGIGKSPEITNSDMSQGGLLAHTMTGTTTIENVYLSMNNPDYWASYVGVWAYKIEGKLNATNVISYVETDRTNMSAFINWTPNLTLNLSNVYCGSKVQMNLVNTSAPTTINLTQYTSLEAMQEAYAANGIDISWATTFEFYQSLVDFLTK